MRAHLYRTILKADGSGPLAPGATVRVLQPGSFTPIVETLYADGSSDSTLSNPFTIGAGVLNFYLLEPQRVRLGIVPTDGPEVFYDDIDVIVPEDSPGGMFTLSGTALGAHPVASVFTWHTLPAFARGLVWRLTLTNTGTTDWGLRVTSGADGSGEVLFEASGIGASTYACSWPWMYQSVTPEFHLGIRNIAGATADFVLTDLRAEVFA